MPPVTGLAVLALALAACGPAGLGGPASDEPAGSTAPAASAAPSELPRRSAPPLASFEPSAPPITGEVPDEILDRILADASERTGVGTPELEVTTAQAVTWSDGSLGCPEPGMLYTQALVDGYQVIVDADGAQLDYRVGAGGSFRLCEGGRPGG